MKYALLLSGVAALCLAACSGSESPAPEASKTATAEASEAAAAPSGDGAGAGAAAAGEAPTEEFIVGTWGEGDACKMPITFAAGGKITDGPFDTWSITDGKLTMGGMISMQLSVVDANTMHSKNDGGGEATLKRCG